MRRPAGAPAHPRRVGYVTRSCSSPVLVEESTEQVASTHGALVILAEASQLVGRVWRLRPGRPVGTVAVVVLDVDAEHLLKVSSAGDQQPVQALGPHRTDPTLGGGVGVGRLQRRDQYLGVVRTEDLVETAAELGVPVLDKGSAPAGPLAQHQQEVAGLLGDPAAVRMGGHPRRGGLAGCPVR
jgi:hypothetical protein